MDSITNTDNTPRTPETSKPKRPGRFECQECEQTFARVEHLTRHSRSHMRERVLKCSFCQKGFYRIDALRRHEQIHTEPKRSALEKGARACLACAAGRRKCSGGLPCSGCESRSIECKYPNTRRPKEGSLPMRYEESSNHSGGDQSIRYSNESLMSWADESGSLGGDHEHSHNYAPNHQPGNVREQVATISYGTPPTFAALYSQRGAQIQPSILPGQSGLVSRDLPAINIPSSHLRHGDPGFGTNAIPESGQSMEENSNRSLQALNWLPENWTPEFVMDDRDDIEPVNQHHYPEFGSRVDNATAHNSFNALTHQDPIRRPRVPSLAVSQLSEGQNCSSPGSQSTQSAGQFYVDGEGARLPRVRKAPYGIANSVIPLSPIEHHQARRGYMFPNIDKSQHASNISNTKEIPLAIYNEILQIFDLTCITSTHYAPFQSTTFPSQRSLSHSISLYIENFQPVFPFLHPTTFNSSTSYWLLVVAIAAIGNHYIESEESELLTTSMHEFTRRAIQYTFETSNDQKADDLVRTQIMLLNCVGMMYCGDERLAKFAKSCHSSLVGFCGAEWSKPISNTNDDMSRASDIHNDWKTWYDGESRRRTGYCIWLLDCMWVFQFQMRPLLSLEDARVPIPCQEVLWEANSALDWQQLYDPSTPSPSLHSAVQVAYIEKTLKSSTGEFSRILCVHALFRRTWEVEDYFRQPLTLWVPTAEKQNVSIIEQSIPVRLPSIKTYSKWRNSTCDVLDILHWHANSVIGATSGMEHPTVLHLHLARVILLTPIQNIMQLAQAMTVEASPNSMENILGLKRQLQQWALEDQHKSRLAMIHAGVLLWHVRRYSVDAFYEPSSVFQATLALWAYGTFAIRPPGTNKEGGSPQESEDSESLFPTSMQLDRPADDELVQLFVKRGANMKANITGVGDLCSAKGPVRVLTEGRRLLLGLKCWRYSQRAIWTLTDLIKVCKHDAEA